MPSLSTYVEPWTAKDVDWTLAMERMQTLPACFDYLACHA